MRRFTWAGRLCRDFLTQPDDVVVFMGDHFSMDTLFWKRTKLQAEGKRYIDEKRAGDLGRQVFDNEVQGCDFKRVMLEGNHCERVKKFIADNPVLEGAIDLWEGWAGAGWEVVPFNDGNGRYIAHGVRCQHYFPGRSGRATGSVSGNARAVLEKVVRYQESVAFGHTHEYDMWQFGVRNGRRVRALNVGCYFEHAEEYAGDDSNARWWRGALLLSNVRDGDYDLHEFSMDTIRELYN